MSRTKRYIETDVLTEARKRVHHIYDTHDSVVVAFSGGKDSLATLHVVWEVAQERGLTSVDAVFRDEEVIYRQVIDFVDEQRELPWLNLRWFCVPLKSTLMVLGSIAEYVQWDPRREWVREMPAWGLREADLGLEPGTVVSQFTADDLTAAPFPGKVCIVTGVRASESLLRFRSCVNKLNENYIVAGSSKKATLGRPLFDWEERDVFRYFYDRELAYCPIYDAQGWAQSATRVSTPINPQTAKILDQLKTFDPELYENVLRVFPQMAIQERYYREFDRAGLKAEYGTSFEGVLAWIERFITDPGQRKTAMREYREVLKRARTDPAAYPPAHVLAGFMTQNGSRLIMPLRPQEDR